MNENDDRINFSNHFYHHLFYQRVCRQLLGPYKRIDTFFKLKSENIGINNWNNGLKERIGEWKNEFI